MLRALRVISVERGHDPRDFALIAFGGAGPLHACALAEELEIGTVLVPAAAGVLSALGLVASDERRDRAVVRRPLAEAGELPAGGRGRPRYAGQSFELTVPLGGDVAEAFHRRTRSATALRTARGMELVAVRTAECARARSSSLPPAEPLGCRPGGARARGRTVLDPPGWVGVRDGTDSTLRLTRL